MDQTNQVLDGSHDQRHRVWIERAQILKARILRSQAERAQSDRSFDDLIGRSRALCEQVATSSAIVGEQSLQIAASIAKAETYIQTARREETLSEPDLLRAERLLMDAKALGDNPLHVGVCHFHLARVASSLGKVEEAIDHYREWKKRSDAIENGFVLKLAADVRREVYETGDKFILDGREWPINYEDADRRLRRSGNFVQMEQATG